MSTRKIVLIILAVLSAGVAGLLWLLIDILDSEEMRGAEAEFISRNPKGG